MLEIKIEPWPRFVSAGSSLTPSGIILSLKFMNGTYFNDIIQHIYDNMINHIMVNCIGTMCLSLHSLSRPAMPRYLLLDEPGFRGRSDAAAFLGSPGSGYLKPKSSFFTSIKFFPKTPDVKEQEAGHSVGGRNAPQVSCDQDLGVCNRES